MDNTNHQETIKELTAPKFGKKQKMPSKVEPRYPMSAEREYMRLSNSYLNLIHRSLSEYLPQIAEMYVTEQRMDDYEYHEDGFISDMSKKLIEAARTFEENSIKFGLDKKIDIIAKQTRKQTLNEWKRTVKKTIGLDLIDEYYGDGFYNTLESEWEGSSKLAMQGIFNNFMLHVQETFENGRKNNIPISKIKKEINESFRSLKHTCAAASRDAISTLASKYAKLNQTDAGCEQYIWSSSRDSRVRDSHRAFDGKVFSWQYPPEGWYMTKAGIVYTGRYCHPGEDYCCRCIAVPVFNKNTLNIPVNGALR